MSTDACPARRDGGTFPCSWECNENGCQAEAKSDELRTAAIEAAEKAVMRAKLGQGWNASDPYAFEGAICALIVDAVLPLLVAGTASRIADAIEAEANRKPKGIREHLSLAGGNWFARALWLLHAARIARRVGETS